MNKKQKLYLCVLIEKLFPLMLEYGKQPTDLQFNEDRSYVILHHCCIREIVGLERMCAMLGHYAYISSSEKCIRIFSKKGTLVIERTVTKCSYDIKKLASEINDAKYFSSYADSMLIHSFCGLDVCPFRTTENCETCNLSKCQEKYDLDRISIYVQMNKAKKLYPIKHYIK
jgi:hypothetical protein